MKIGQIASQQAEYIPADYCGALVGLRSQVAPMDIATVRGQIEKYLGKQVEELYASFDEKPLGSASIAQVHRATLFDGTVVAVKVPRPGEASAAGARHRVDRLRHDGHADRIRALIIVAALIGACLLCTAPEISGGGGLAATIVFRTIGFAGIVVSLFFAQRLYREMKKGK